MFETYNRWFDESRWQTVELPPFVNDIPAMLSPNERAAYYLAACDRYSFAGKILDCGVLMGGTTAALIYGLLNNRQLFRNFDRLPELIRVYDRFLVGNDVYLDFFEQHYNKKYATGDSFYNLFLERVRPFQPLIKIHAGDIRQQFWQEEAFIELLGLDICKREDITTHIAKEFFPYLQANRSVVIQQDYANGWQPHIIYCMEMLSDKFEKILEVDDLAAFQCVAQIEKAEVCERLDYYCSDRRRPIALIERAIEKAVTPDTSWFLKLARVKLLGDSGDAARGLADLDELEARASSEIRKLATYESNFETECQRMRNWLISQQQTTNDRRRKLEPC